MFTRNLKMMSAAGAAAILLSGCSFAGGLTKNEQAIVNDLAPSKYQPASRDIRNNIDTQDTFAQAAFWSREYQLNPADLEAAIKLSAAVRKMGNPSKAVEIAQTSRAMYPRDPYLLAEYAAALIASERGSDALEALDTGLRTAPGYARLWSLKGAALDQQENYELARKHYARALQITPRDPNVMSNLGLSYALAGDPRMAETWMRRAAAQPGAGANIKQNLNLIMQLQGKSVEAQSSQVPYSQAQAPALRPAPSARAPRTYGQAVQSFESRPQSNYSPSASAARPQRPSKQSFAAYEGKPPARQAPSRQVQKQRSQARPSYKSAATPAPQGQFGYRSNITAVGGQGKAQSASDMARAAAARSQGQGRKVTLPMGESPQAAPLDILSRLSSSVGPRPTQQYAQTEYQPQYQGQTQPNYQEQAQPQYQSQSAPSYGYPSAGQAQGYGEPQDRRGAARRR